jgi:large subunit ribosomal protein L29
MDITTAQEEIKTLRRQLFDLRLQKERGEVKNNRQFPQVKADVARLMHHIGELNHAARVAAEGGLDDEATTPQVVERSVATTDEDEA